jgi:HK97 family phage major capsid protein
MKMFTLEDLQNRLLEITEQSTNIINTAKAEDRDLSDDEMADLDRLDGDYKNVKRQIEQLERVQAQADYLSQSMGRQTDPNEVVNQSNEGDQPPRAGASGIDVITRPEVKRNFGFQNLGEFAMAVRAAAVPGGGSIMDPRLIKAAPTTISTEGVGADGGFAVPPDYRTAIMEKVMSEDSLLSRTDQLISSSNTIVLPKDETTPWQTSGGVLAYWEGEADQLAQSKVALQQETLRLNKLAALIPVTEELMEDAPSLDSYLRKKVPEKFDFKINLALVQGTGAGQPTGILNSGCIVSIAKESGQSADTIMFENIVNMWARMYGPCRPRAVWLVNQDIEPQLFTMSFEGTSSSVPAYLPAGGLSASPYGLLMGRPVIPTQACETLGDKGDIFLADFSQYLSAIKTGGVRAEVSIHLWFDYDVTAYRFIMRVAGQPWWAAAIDPRDGSNTLSPFVTLDERA